MKYYIYAIKNLVNDKLYIGLTKNYKKRWYQHRYDLKNNRHRNSKLQNAYNKYGNHSFIYYVLEIQDCDFNYIANREIYYIKLYNSCDNGYNLTYGGDGTDSRKVSDSTKEKLRLAMLGNTYSLGKKQSDITRKLKSISMKNCADMKERKKRASLILKNLWETDSFRKMMHDKNIGNKYNLGNHLSEETKSKLSELRVGCKNPFYGKHHEDETKKILSDNMKNMWEDKDFRDKTLASLHKVMNTEEYKNKQRMLSQGRSNKTTEKDALEIRYRYLSGEKPIDIYKDFNKLSLSGLKKICYCDSWKHLPNNKEDLQNMLINYQLK